MKRGLLALTLVAVVVPAVAANAQGAKPSKRCDFTDPAVCLYPWPNDLFTRSDDDSATGRRLNLKRASMPRNKDGKPIEPRDMNRADGSALVWWDSGTPPPPLVNQPNREGTDPHSHPRNEPAARVQKSEFLKLGGGVVRVCGGRPCFANGYTGP